MDKQRTVFLEDLGLCEHCGALSSLKDMPARSNISWRCLRCGRKLTIESFGYKRRDGTYRKIKWVNGSCKWTEIKPAEDFKLGGLYVMINQETNK